MSEEKSSFTKDIEDLVSKSIEANKVFLSESTRMVKQFTDKSARKENINIFQPDLISNAFNAYAKLNIQHLKNMIDLGVSLAKQTGTQQTADNSAKAGATADPGPAFVLNGTAEAGSKATLHFLLDNVKLEAATCRLVNSDYTLQADSSVQQVFKTIFLPQSFVLNPAESQTVNIEISIPAKTKPGIYAGNVQVEGFEPAFFSMYITVNEKQPKTSVNGNRKSK